MFRDLGSAARVEYVLMVLVGVMATAEKQDEGAPPRSCPIVAQMTLGVAHRPTSNDLLAVRSNCCSPCLFRGLSAAARVEYVLVALVDVVATAEMREEGIPLVCPSFAQMTLSM